MSETAAADGASGSEQASGHLAHALRPYARPLGGGLVLTGLLVLVFWDLLLRQFQWAIREQHDWGHTLVIPFLAGYFVYRNRSRLLETPFRTTWIGLLPLIAGVAWYIFTAIGPQAIRHHNVQFAGFGLSLVGIVLLFCGFRAMKWLWFPLAYLLLFGQSVSERFMHVVTFRMQDIAALGSEKMLILMGMDVTREGNQLTLFWSGTAYPLNIAEACSGMRMLMAFLALGVAMAYMGLRFNWQRVLLVALGVPIAIFVNMLRVVSLGFLSILHPELARGEFHMFVGMVWLVPAFLLFLGAMWLVKRLVIEEHANAQPTAEAVGSGRITTDGSRRGFDRRAKIALVTACLTLLVSGVGFRAAVQQLNIFLRKEAVHLRAEFTSIPSTLGRWQAADDNQYDAALIEELGTRVYLDRTYVRTRNRFGMGDSSSESARESAPLNVHLAYYTGMIDAVPHIPDRCMVAGGFQPTELPEVIRLHVDSSGWIEDTDHVNASSGLPYRLVAYSHPITGRPMQVRMPIIRSSSEAGEAAVRLRTTEFRHAELRNARVFAGFFFIANGQLTPYPETVRTFAFDRTDRHAYYCKVQFFSHGGPEYDRDAFAADVSELLEDLLPELMRCLPDWAEVESRQPEKAVDESGSA